jgi:hypothetical protein
VPRPLSLLDGASARAHYCLLAGAYFAAVAGSVDQSAPPPAGWLLAAVVLPPLALAIAGLFHPIYLTNASAMRWHDLHVVLLPVFPLLALGPWLLGRRHGRVLGAITGLLGYTFATFYTALDVLAGIGAGALQERRLGGTVALFGQADALARVGTWAYLGATVLAAVAGCLVSRRRSVVALISCLAGTVLVVAAAWTFRTSHIFWPRGVLAMLALAVGWAALAAFAPPPRHATHQHT